MKTIIISGGRGTGKTSLLIAAAKEYSKTPSTRILVVTPSFYEADMIRRKLNGEHVIRFGRLYINFDNGSTIDFVFGKEDTKLMGRYSDVVLIDNADSLNKEVYDRAVHRMNAKFILETRLAKRKNDDDENRGVLGP